MPDGSPRQRAGQLAHRRTKWQALQAEDRVTQAIQGGAGFVPRVMQSGGSTTMADYCYIGSRLQLAL